MPEKSKLFCIVPEEVLKQVKVIVTPFPERIKNTTIEHNGKYYIDAEEISKLFYSGLFLDESVHEEYQNAIEKNDHSHTQMIFQSSLHRYMIHCAIEKLIAEKESEKLFADTD